MSSVGNRDQCQKIYKKKKIYLHTSYWKNFVKKFYTTRSCDLVQNRKILLQKIQELIRSNWYSTRIHQTLTWRLTFTDVVRDATVIQSHRVFTGRGGGGEERKQKSSPTRVVQARIWFRSSIGEIGTRFEVVNYSSLEWLITSTFMTVGLYPKSFVDILGFFFFPSLETRQDFSTCWFFNRVVISIRFGLTSSSVTLEILKLRFHFWSWIVTIFFRGSYWWRSFWSLLISLRR